MEKVSIDSLKEFEGNPRKGNVNALVESLTVNGQYRPIVVQTSTKKILAGNHLWKAAKQLGWKDILVTYVDVDDVRAKKIVAADNRLADMGSYDEDALLKLLEDITLEGTGYVQADVDDLLALIEEQTDPQWQTAPQHSSQENVQHRPTLAERAEHYAERTIRLLMCEYPNEQYIWVVERLGEIRKEFDVDNNADAIIKIVEQHTKQEAPK